MRPPANTATLGVAFGLVNLGLLVYMGAPLPPQPYLSMLVVFLIHLLLFAYTPVLIHLLGGAGDRSGDAAYQALGGSTGQPASANPNVIMICRTRILIYIANWFTIFIRGSFKDGQYTAEYHHGGFAIIMTTTGVCGGFGCLALWFAVASETNISSAPQQPSVSESNEGPVTAEEGREGIQLGDNAASWDKAADKV
ncbi:hypothetical protein QFC21_003445 [Naganishia friedmannii]|uniref:Uncharacterized protein n=1 Tax=Naganishia friedmannii TaxID=89922 RepID=A0ACC2VQ30_9TREE|nr:hypothetical protein QFC21_003445 [Naganishia friedmannii]